MFPTKKVFLKESFEDAVAELHGYLFFDWHLPVQNRTDWDWECLIECHGEVTSILTICGGRSRERWWEDEGEGGCHHDGDVEEPFTARSEKRKVHHEKDIGEWGEMVLKGEFIHHEELVKGSHMIDLMKHIMLRNRNVPPFTGWWKFLISLSELNIPVSPFITKFVNNTIIWN